MAFLVRALRSLKRTTCSRAASRHRLATVGQHYHHHNGVLPPHPFTPSGLKFHLHREHAGLPYVSAEWRSWPLNEREPTRVDGKPLTAPQRRALVTLRPPRPARRVTCYVLRIDEKRAIRVLPVLRRAMCLFCVDPVYVRPLAVHCWVQHFQRTHTDVGLPIFEVPLHFSVCNAVYRVANLPFSLFVCVCVMHACAGALSVCQLLRTVAGERRHCVLRRVVAPSPPKPS